MKKEAYRNGIQRLEDCFGWKLPEGAVRLWWERLGKQQLSDRDFMAGCCKLIDSCKRFPALAEVIEACKEARQKRQIREYEAKKLEESKYRDLTLNQLVTCGKNKQQEVQALVHNTEALLSREIDLPTWCEAQKTMVTDEISQVEIRRLENKIFAKLGQAQIVRIDILGRKS